MKKFITVPISLISLLKSSNLRYSNIATQVKTKQFKKYQLLYSSKYPPNYRPNEITNSQLRPKIIAQTMFKYWPYQSLSACINFSIGTKSSELFYYCCCLITIQRLLILVSQKSPLLYKGMDVQGTISNFIQLIQSVEAQFSFTIQKQISAFLYMVMDQFESNARQISYYDRLSIYIYLIRNQKANQKILKQFDQHILRIPSAEDFEMIQHDPISRRIKLLENIVMRIKGMYYLRQSYPNEFKNISVENFKAHLETYLKLLQQEQILSEILSKSQKKQFFLKTIVFEQQCLPSFKAQYLKVLLKIFNSSKNVNFFYEDYFLTQIFQSINSFYSKTDYQQLLPCFQGFQMMVINSINSHQKNLQTPIKVCHYFGFCSSILFNLYMERMNQLIDKNEEQFSLTLIQHNCDKLKFAIQNFDFYSSVDSNIKLKCQKQYMKWFGLVLQKISFNNHIYMKDIPMRTHHFFSYPNLDYSNKRSFHNTIQSFKDIIKIIKDSSLFLNQYKKYNLGEYTTKKFEQFVDRFKLSSIVACIVTYMRLCKKYKPQITGIEFPKLIQNNQIVYKKIKENIGYPGLLKNMVQILILYEKSTEDYPKFPNFLEVLRYIDSSRNTFSTYFLESSNGENKEQTANPQLFLGHYIRENLYISTFKKQKKFILTTQNISLSIENDWQIKNRLDQNQKQSKIHKVLEEAKQNSQLSKVIFKRKYIEYPFLLDYAIKYRNIFYGVIIKNSINKDYQQQCAAYFARQHYKIVYISSEQQMAEFLQNLKTEISSKK